MNISGASKSIVLNVDDSKDAAQRNVTISSTIEVTPGGIGFFQGTISGLAANDITYLPAQLKSLTLSAGFGGNTFVFSDTGPAVPTIVNTGAGADTSFVQATSGALTLNGVNGADVLNVGAGFRTNLINGALNITNSGGHTAINIDDCGDDSSSNIALANTGSSASVSGAAPALITYVQNDLSTLTIIAGSHGNTFNVTDTPQANAAAQTILNTGTGADMVNVLRSTGPLFVNGQNGRDTVNVGLNNNVQSIKGALNISNTFSFSAINLNDQADANGHTVTMGTNPGANQGSVFGLAPAIVLYRLGDLSTLTVNTGSGADTIKVQGTASNGGGPASTVVNTGPGFDTVNVFETTGPLTVSSGAGNDTVNIGDIFNTVEELEGTVTVNGQTETDILNVNDQGSATPHTYTTTVSTVQRSGTATINYSGIERLSVHKGPSSNSAPLVKKLTFPNSVHAKELATLSGRLADANSGDHLSLVVDWGDGSAPQHRKPERKPFALKHLFRKAGTHTIRVIWTDSTGESNSQDLSVVVTPKQTRTAVAHETKAHLVHRR